MILFAEGITFPSFAVEETIAVIARINSKNTTKNDKIKPSIEANTNLKNSFILGLNALTMQVYKFTESVIGYLLQSLKLHEYYIFVTGQ